MAPHLRYDDLKILSSSIPDEDYKLPENPTSADMGEFVHVVYAFLATGFPEQEYDDPNILLTAWQIRVIRAAQRTSFSCYGSVKVGPPRFYTNRDGSVNKSWARATLYFADMEVGRRFLGMQPHVKYSVLKDSFLLTPSSSVLRSPYPCPTRVMIGLRGKERAAAVWADVEASCGRIHDLEIVEGPPDLGGHAPRTAIIRFVRQESLIRATQTSTVPIPSGPNHVWLANGNLTSAARESAVSVQNWVGKNLEIYTYSLEWLPLQAVWILRTSTSTQASMLVKESIDVPGLGKVGFGFVSKMGLKDGVGCYWPATLETYAYASASDVVLAQRFSQGLPIDPESCTLSLSQPNHPSAMLLHAPPTDINPNARGPVSSPSKPSGSKSKTPRKRTTPKADRVHKGWMQTQNSAQNGHQLVTNAQLYMANQRRQTDQRMMQQSIAYAPQPHLLPYAPGPSIIVAPPGFYPNNPLANQRLQDRTNLRNFDAQHAWTGQVPDYGQPLQSWTQPISAYGSEGQPGGMVPAPAEFEEDMDEGGSDVDVTEKFEKAQRTAEKVEKWYGGETWTTEKDFEGKMKSKKKRVKKEKKSGDGQ